MINQPSPSKNLYDVARLFLKLGFTAFGGPAAHIAMMHDEVVKRRKWLDEQRFLDLFGAANMIPGPSSTEMAIDLGYQRAGWPGLVLGGVLFIPPAMLIVLGLAWAYVRFGATPAAGRLFYGIKPVVIAIIAQALWGLAPRAVKSRLAALIGLAALGLYLLGVNVLILLAAGGLVMALALLVPPRWGGLVMALAPLLPPRWGGLVMALAPLLPPRLRRGGLGGGMGGALSCPSRASACPPWRRRPLAWCSSFSPS